jgi:hypothetical protein
MERCESPKDMITVSLNAVFLICGFFGGLRGE